MTDEVMPVLEKLWAEGWTAGWDAASEVSGIEVPVDQTMMQGRIAQMASQWAAQIAQTTLKLAAGILAAGGATLAAVTQALQDAGRWQDVALTEVTRASSEGAAALYASNGIIRIRWVTEPGACEECVANEAAGEWPLGVPFPSGATAPPQHPNCRCAIVPA